MVHSMFRRLRAFLGYLLIIFITSFPGSAQVVSLYDAVARATANYPLLQQRRAEIAAARAHVNTVNGSRLPSLLLHEQLGLGSDNPLQGAYFSLGTIPSTPGGYAAVHNNPNPDNTAIAYLKWDFYTFGYYNAQQKEAKSALAVNEASLVSDRYMLTENMVALYLDWLKTYRLLQIETQNVDRARVILTAIRANVQSGLKPGVDSSTASASFSVARIAYLQALDNFNTGRIAIAAYTGISGNNIVPDTVILSPSALPAGVPVNTADSVPTSHPLLIVYQKQYEQQLSTGQTISRKYLPRLGFDAAAWVRNSGISYAGVYPADLSAGMPYNRSNYLFGLTLSYNLFDMKHRRDELVENSFLSQAKQSQLQTRQLELNRMVQQANATYATTLEKLNELPVQLTSARQAYAQQLALYRAGLNTLIDVTNAQYVLLQAETGYVITQDELAQLLYIRAGLGGQLDNFLQNFKR